MMVFAASTSIITMIIFLLLVASTTSMTNTFIVDAQTKTISFSETSTISGASTATRNRDLSSTLEKLSRTGETKVPTATLKYMTMTLAEVEEGSSSSSSSNNDASDTDSATDSPPATDPPTTPPPPPTSPPGPPPTPPFDYNATDFPQIRNEPPLTIIGVALGVVAVIVIAGILHFLAKREQKKKLEEAGDENGYNAPTAMSEINRRERNRQQDRLSRNASAIGGGGGIRLGGAPRPGSGMGEGRPPMTPMTPAGSNAGRQETSRFDVVGDGGRPAPPSTPPPSGALSPADQQLLATSGGGGGSLGGSNNLDIPPAAGHNQQRRLSGVPQVESIVV